jgi:hypothetical protein
MIPPRFRLASMSEASVEKRAELSAELADELMRRASLELGPVIARIINDLQIEGHELAPERPWSTGEFAFSDPSFGVSGLRVAFDLVVSVGFADRMAE